MLNSLPLYHRIAGQPVIVLGEGEAAAAKRRLVERAGGVCVGEDNPDARLAFVALDRPEEAAERLRTRGVLVNVVDRPELCDFTIPSLLERGPVLVAVGTGGVSAGLAKALRLRLEALIPPQLGALAEALGAARQALKERFPKPVERRAVLDAALTDGGPLDPLRYDGTAEVLPVLLEGNESADLVTEFTLRSDDPDDLTLGHARALGSADLVMHEPGVPPAILVRARADAAQCEVAKGADAGPQLGRVVVIRRG